MASSWLACANSFLTVLEGSCKARETNDAAVKPGDKRTLLWANALPATISADLASYLMQESGANARCLHTSRGTCVDSWGEGGCALDVVLVRAVGLQGSGGVGEVLVGYEHGESDAESESSHDEQKLQVGAGVDKGQHRKQHEEDIGAVGPETRADKGNSKKRNSKESEKKVQGL